MDYYSHSSYPLGSRGLGCLAGEVRVYSSDRHSAYDTGLIMKNDDGRLESRRVVDQGQKNVEPGAQIDLFKCIFYR